MKRIKLFIIIFSILAAVGCAEEIIDSTSTGDGIRVTAGFADTKTTFVDGENSVSVEWLEDDAIGIYTESQVNLEYRSAASGIKAAFLPYGEALDGEDGDKVYAYYPYDSGSEGMNKVRLPMTVNQFYTEDAAKIDFVYSSADISSDNVSFRFKHLFAYLKLTIPLKYISGRGVNGGLLLSSTEDIGCDNFFDLKKGELLLDEVYRYTSIRYYIPADDQLGDQTEVTCYIAILPQSENAVIDIRQVNDGADGSSIISKKAPAGGFKAGNVYSLYINESNEEIERNALIALYNSTNGDKWVNNTNWCSDKPVSEWYGVMAWAPEGGVSDLHLMDNNLTGTLPNELADMPFLESVRFERNSIGGSIPSKWGDWKGPLWTIELSYNNLTGDIPDELGKLADARLKYPDKGFNISLWHNNLTGTLPESLGKLSNCFIDIGDNKLFGPVPEAFTQNMTSWVYHWPWQLVQSGDGFDRNSFELKAPPFSAFTCLGGHIDNSVYSQNKYTLLLEWFSNKEFSDEYVDGLKTIYANYRSKGLEIVQYSSGYDVQELISYGRTCAIPWPLFASTGNGGEAPMLLNCTSPAVNIVDENGNIVMDSFYTPMTDTPEEHLKLVEDFLLDKLGDPDPISPTVPDYPGEFYTSTDYSEDGNVITLQKATKGKGIDIVLMGDAFSDKQIADGIYRQVMEKAADFLFAEEPYKTYRDHFNIYMVNVVSENDVYLYGARTALGCYFDTGTLVGGNDERCFDYALQAISADRMNEAMIVVMMNSDRYAGTCYMYIPETENDYASGVSVSYFPVGSDDETFRQVLNHETNGHGFSNLADEYSETGELEDVGIIESAEYMYEHHGWYKNVDFTSDPTKVKWHKFLEDSRYSEEGLGVYQGAYAYASGAWRPSENSIMRYNTGGFNAPSREAIYYRIHKLAYGADWVYDYEDFVEYDTINRNKAETKAAGVPYPYRLEEPEDFVPLAPPVIYNHSWREALK